ncbi:MAG: chorismate-binding protein [Janthinobacterium lividum]
MSDSSSSIIPEEGALLSLPGQQGMPRQTWMIRGATKRSSRPNLGSFSLYSPDFFLDDPKPWFIPENPAILKASAEPSIDSTSFQPLALDWEPPSSAFFEECFQDLQTLFRSGRLTKAVPVFFEQAAFSLSQSHLAQWISILLHAPETLTPYGRWSAEGGILGASPELLFEIRGGVLSTVALAGTLAAPETSDPAALLSLENTFMADPKERREHRLVIDGIVDSLAPFGSVTVGETSVLKLPTLWHLKTPLEVALREAPDFESLVHSLHPTPALGGSPRDASLQWLRRLDERQKPNSGRGSFGAPFGAQLPDGSAFCLVAVRNMMWDTKTLRIGAGCGIIQESRMEREWEELRQKRASVKKLFDLQ